MLRSAQSVQLLKCRETGSLEEAKREFYAGRRLLMFQLIYASAAVKPFTPEGLSTLLAKARKKNKAVRVTGMLLYHGGSFLQVLEGPEEAVTELFKVIEKDPRHANVRVLLRDGIETPEFDEWSMGFVDTAKAAQVLEGFLDYNTEVNAALLDTTRAKKTLNMFRDGSWRQSVEK